MSDQRDGQRNTRRLQINTARDFMVESKLVSGRALLNSRQARFTQSLMARPEGHGSAESLRRS